MKGRRLWATVERMKEEELRRQVVIPLLCATQDVRNVTDVHGDNERGLDVVFFAETGIEKTCYGLQLKTGAIGGGGRGKATVKEIINQLELADDFQHPVATGSAGVFKIDRFVVATNGKISGTAREEIARRVSKTKILFWDRDELVRRIHQDLPQLFQVSDGASVAYLKILEQRLDVLDALDQIPGVAKRTLTDVFEDRILRRKFDPSISSTASDNLGAINSLELLDQQHNAIVLADQDGGKTSILRMTCLQAMRSMLAGKREPTSSSLPLLVNARDIAAHGFILMDAFRAELIKLKANDLAGTLETDLASGNYFVCIDGFSELLQEEDRSLLAEQIGGLAAKYSHIRIIVAGRPVDFLKLRYLPSFFQYTIQDFDERQVAALVKKWLGNSSVRFADVPQKMIARIRDALQLPGSPIPATIGVMLHEQQDRYVTNTADAIDRYMVIRLGRYAHELGMKQQVDWSKKQDLLAEVAFAMVDNNEDTVTRVEFISRFNSIFARQGEALRGDLVVDELLDTGVLVQEGNRLAFHRSSLRDFFSAHHVNQRGDLDSFAQSRLFARKWGGTIVFAAGLRRNNSGLLNKLSGGIDQLRERALGDVTDDYLYAAYACGKVLSNSDGSDHSARIGALRVFLRASTDALPDFEKALKEQYGNIGEVIALFGGEQTFFVTVGVPWLRQQYRELVAAPDLSDEERYLLASTYASLGFDDAYQILEKAVRDSTKTPVLVLLDFFLKQLEHRSVDGGESSALEKIRTLLRRKLDAREERVKELLKLKSPALEMERQRVKRIENQRRKDNPTGENG
jgi:hypothetical protein